VKLLIDTQVLIWTLLEQERLATTAAEAIADEANDVFVSVVSAWEIEIKIAKNKLHGPSDLGTALAEQRFKLMQVTLDHVLAVESLPRHHRDPFDRMLIAQAQLGGLTLLTSDREFRRYPIATLPAI
jgi:PIN domain nuclease of toxin-antitoxin system